MFSLYIVMERFNGTGSNTIVGASPDATTLNASDDCLTQYVSVVITTVALLIVTKREFRNED